MILSAKQLIESEEFDEEFLLNAAMSTPRKILWFRQGDGNDPESADDIEELGLEDRGLGKFKSWITGRVNPRTGQFDVGITVGFQTWRGYFGNNYLSIYWGDKNGNFIHGLDDDEKAEVENLLGKEDVVSVLEQNMVVCDHSASTRTLQNFIGWFGFTYDHLVGTLDDSDRRALERFWVSSQL